MSHEIRTPMNGVVGMTELLLETSLSPIQREYADTIRRSAEALLSVINEVLELSKIEAGKLQLAMSDFDVVDVIEDTLSTFAAGAGRKGLDLVGDLPPRAGCHVRGDPGRFRQVLANLVGNAIKFTERGEIVVRLATLSDREGTITVLVSVKDTGPGLTPDAQSRLFRPYVQADGAVAATYGGTGLGLAISRQLVTLMGGEIGIESELGKGSTFWFTARFEKPSRDASAQLPPLGMGEIAHLHVLVVDDNDATRETIAQQLSSWGVRYGSAVFGTEALEQLMNAQAAGDRYDMALLEMGMADMDGLTLARAIKADPTLTGTRLVALVTLNDMLDSETLRASGFDGYLVKPVKQSLLFDLLVNASLVPAGLELSGLPAPRPDPAVAPKLYEPLRVLLAEDNPVNQRVALEQLAKLGWKADVAANGTEVLSAVERAAYDVILMDCEMPELSGFDATRKIRARERTERAPWRSSMYIVALTANAMEGDRERCLAAGMNDYIPKPVRLADLKSALARARTSVTPVAASN